MLRREVDRYLKSKVAQLFFYSVKVDSYQEALNDLTERGLVVIHVSDFCEDSDLFPNEDRLTDHLKSLTSGSYVLTGLGEALALRGARSTRNTLQSLKDVSLNGARVVLLLRGVYRLVAEFENENPRLVERGLLFRERGEFGNFDDLSPLDAMKVAPELAESYKAVDGVKALLQRYEKNAGRYAFSSSLDFSNSSISIKKIDNAYDVLKNRELNFQASESLGTAEQWTSLVKALGQKGTVDEFLSERSFGTSSSKLHQYTAGDDFTRWLFFLWLKLTRDSLTSEYLRRVVDETDKYDALRQNLFAAILRVDRNDPRYWLFYRERKEALKAFTDESDVAKFIHDNNVSNDEERVYRLTDNTSLERRDVLSWIALYKRIPEKLDVIYPALALYLKDYVFHCGAVSELLTDYFKDYKRQKLFNDVSPEFLEKVQRNAKESTYTKLETRANVFKNLDDGKTFLYWVDALGVEYLSYITQLAYEKGFAVHVDIARADLPTVTSVNKGFFESWNKGKKDKDSDLDDTVHQLNGEFDFNPEDLKFAPIHLGQELEIVRHAVEMASKAFNNGQCAKFIIASDHGASRLAVVFQSKGQTDVYETGEKEIKGLEGGRFCQVYDGWQKKLEGQPYLPCIVEEGERLVLGDYGRFRGSMPAKVEIHGGYSLEEVVVPIITLSLKDQSQSYCQVELIKKDKIKADKRQGTLIELYIVGGSGRVRVEVEGVRYDVEQKDSTHYSVLLTGIKRAKKGVVAKVFDADALIGTVSFDVESSVAKFNNGFDF